MTAVAPSMLQIFVRTLTGKDHHAVYTATSLLELRVFQ